LYVVAIDESQLIILMDLFQIGALDINVFPSDAKQVQKNTTGFHCSGFSVFYQNKLDKEIVKCSDN